MDTQSIFFILFGLVAASMLFKVIKNKGWKGAMFGAPTRKQTCEIELGSRGMVKTKLKVHVLDPRDRGEGPHVGIEVIHSTFGSWQMSPISLTRTESQRLADELSRAAKDSETASG